MPVEVLRVRLASPPAEAHPVATAPASPGQFASESVAFGPANGEKDPATVPCLIAMPDEFAAPVTENVVGCAHLVGALPAGVVQVILNLDAGVGAGRAMPLKMVAQLLAVPAMLNVSVPAMVPRTAMPVVATHGLAVLPRAA